MTEREMTILRAINFSDCTNIDWGFIPNEDKKHAHIYVKEPLKQRIKDTTGIEPDGYTFATALYAVSIEESENAAHKFHGGSCKSMGRAVSKVRIQKFLKFLRRKEAHND